MISYEPLWQTMKEKGITTYTLRVKIGFSAGTLDRLKQNRYVSTHTIDNLCNLLDCDVQDVMIHLRDNTGQGGKA